MYYLVFEDYVFGDGVEIIRQVDVWLK